MRGIFVTTISMMGNKLPLIKFFTFTGNVLLPLYAFLMCYLFKQTLEGVLFALLISAMIIERGWKTFKTTKEHRKEEFHGDWTLAVVTGTYLTLFFFLITEFYVRVAVVSTYLSILGLAILTASFKLRFWGMAALGKQWAVHAVGVQKIKKVRLIKIGPYKYIRHPIYLGIILEELSYPIIANAYYALIFAALVCIPLVIVRAWTEEKTSLRRLGDQYVEYKREIGMLFPTQLLKRYRSGV